MNLRGYPFVESCGLGEGSPPFLHWRPDAEGSGDAFTCTNGATIVCAMETGPRAPMQCSGDASACGATAMLAGVGSALVVMLASTCTILTISLAPMRHHNASMSGACVHAHTGALASHSGGPVANSPWPGNGPWPTGWGPLA